MPPQSSLDGCGLVLESCRKKRGLLYALSLQAYMRGRGLGTHRSLGGQVVSLLVDMGLMPKALFVFDSLPYKNEESWNSLISGLVRFGQPHHALKMYHGMLKNDSIHPNAPTFSALLKACGKLKDTAKGLAIHRHISRIFGIRRDAFVANSLVDMYAKCGLLAEARRIFNEIPMRDVVSWTTMISGYFENGHEEEALFCFERMQKEGIIPNEITFVFALKACGSIGCPYKALEIEAKVEKQGLLREHVLVGNALIDSFSKCGWLSKAYEVLDKIPYRNVVSWTSLLGGYVEQGYAEQALRCFEHMKAEGISLDAASFVCILRACGMSGSITKGEEVHAEIDRHGLLDANLLVGSTLIDMYAKCGLLAKAQEVFDRLPIRNVVSWNALTAGYAAHGQVEEALGCFRDMKLDGIYPDDATYACVMKACGSTRMTGSIIREIHAEIARRELPERNLLVANTLINAYARHGFLSRAKETLKKLLVRDVFSWTSLMTGCIEHGHGEAALECFQQMQEECISPDTTSFVCCLKACGMIPAITIGEELHRKIEECGISASKDLALGNSLLHMYAKWGMLEKAKQVFDELKSRNIVSWNALITGYIENRYHEKAMECYDKMKAEGILSPNSITLVSVLNVCDDVGAIDKVVEIHGEIESQELLEKDLIVGNVLLKIYAKWGLLAKAQQVFEKLHGRNIISWTTLLMGYDKHGHGERALGCFEQIRSVGMPLNAITYICSLKACRNIGATNKGLDIHSEIERHGLLGEDLVGNTLVDMYAKFGYLKKAREVFYELPERDVVSWTSLMSGYTRFGKFETVFRLFDTMLGEGVKPDAVTFIVLLTACDRANLWNKCERYFNAMEKDYGIAPMPLHHNCVVSLLARVGRLNKALGIIENMSVKPDVAAWRSILGASRRCGNVRLGKRAFIESILSGVG